MLLDSNLIIYAWRPQYASLRQLIADHSPAVSAISVVEVLGYHRLDAQQRILLEEFFSAAAALPVDDAVVAQAVLMRRQKRMALGDSLVAATARVHKLKLLLQNVSDFQWIGDLEVFDPLAAEVHD